MSRFAYAALLSVLLSLPAAAADAPAEPAKPMAMMGGGMGQHCKQKGMMAGGCNCPKAEAMAQRIEALEKRLDLMQATVELLARQPK